LTIFFLYTKQSDEVNKTRLVLTAFQTFSNVTMNAWEVLTPQTGSYLTMTLQSQVRLGSLHLHESPTQYLSLCFKQERSGTGQSFNSAFPGCALQRGVWRHMPTSELLQWISSVSYELWLMPWQET
jgi:hypothetical protein